MKRAFILSLVLFLASSTQAHRQWILTSSTILSGESAWITVDSVRSNNIFFANHTAPNLEFHQVYDPKGNVVELQNSITGKIRTVFDVELQEQGTYKIVYGSSGFFAFWMEGEERRRWSGSEEEFIQQNIKDKPGVRVSKSNATVETYVTLGEPTFEVLAPDGEGIELVFEKHHPNDLFTEEEATFTVHHQGKPAKGFVVTIVKDGDRYRDDAGDIVIETDENGRFAYTWPTAGRYWMEISAPRPEGASAGQGGRPGPLPADAPTVDGVPYRVHEGYTGTFEVLPQ